MSLVGKYLSSLEHFDSLPDTLTDDITTDGENSYVAGIPEAVIKPMENSEQSNESDGVITDDNQAMNEKKEAVAESEDDGSTTDTEENQGDSTEDTQVEEEQSREGEPEPEESEDGLDSEETGEEEDDFSDVQYSVEHHATTAKNSNQSCSPTPPRNPAMLNIKAYVPSMEEFDDVPSPLMEGDAPAVIDSHIAEPLVPVAVDGAPLPIEQVVELPPHLDPTPIQPLEGEVIQEEIIAEHADTEAGQLLGAQIALESYSKLLRNSNANMTRQSAAFLAVGMRRAERLVPGVSLGLEDENSGSQVMAMQKANVDKEGLGSKIKAMGAKIWEWLKQKYQQLKGLWEKFRAAKNKETTTYLIAAAKVVEKPTEQSIKALPAPPAGVQVGKAMGSDVDVQTVLDAIHGTQKDSRSVQLPAGISGAVTRNGKLDLNFSEEHKLCYEFLHQYLKDGTALLQEAKGIMETASADKATQEIADRLSDAVKKTMSGKPAKLELHGFSVIRDAEGRITFEDGGDAGQLEVKLPSPQEIGRMLEDKKKAIDEDDDVGMQLANKFMDLGTEMVETGDTLSAKLEQSELAAIESAVGKVLKDYAIADIMAEIVKRVVRLSTNVDRAADFFLSHHLGKGNTISQEDFDEMPAKGMGAKLKSAGKKIADVFRQLIERAKEAFRKFKAIFSRDKTKVEYLGEVAKAAASGKTEPVQAPEGAADLNVAKAKSYTAPAKSSGGPKIKLGSGEATLFVKGGQLNLDISNISALAETEFNKYVAAATQYYTQIAGVQKGATKGTTAEQITEQLEKIASATVGANPVNIQFAAEGTYTRDEQGMVSFDLGSADSVEVDAPDMAKVSQFLQGLEKLVATAEKYDNIVDRVLEGSRANSEMRDNAEARLGPDTFEAVHHTMLRFGMRKGFSPLENIQEIQKIVGVVIKNGISMADRILASQVSGGSVSTEAYGDMVVTDGKIHDRTGIVQRGVTMAKEAWRKLREFMQRLWDQFSAWCQKLWGKIRGTEADTDVLLLTNNAAPDEPGAAPGPAPDLPTGTRMRSVQAVRLLTGPSATAPVSTTPEAAPITPDTGVDTSGGMVVVKEALEIMLGSGIEVDPIWEETMVTWLVRHYIPTQAKIVRDLTSWAGSSNFDGGITEWMPIVEGAMGQLWQGLPNGNVPGQRTVEPGDGTKIRIRQEGMMGNPPALKPLKRGQIDQALARQKKVLKGLEGIEKFRMEAERQRTQLNAMLDRRVAAGVSEDSVSSFYNHVETNIIQSSAAVVAGVITKMCDARNVVFDAMIVARAKK